MPAKPLNKSELKQIDRAVELYVQNQARITTFAKSLAVNLTDDEALRPYVHFLKWRIKDPEHLRKKLYRKAIQRKIANKKPDIDAENLFERVDDLAGVRIIHLHTEQIESINKILGNIFDELRITLLEGPTAICWDREYEDLYKSLGIKPESRDSMYSSVHYIIEANQKSKLRAEIQVRTLMEEVWGEVSHRVDYPSATMSRACKDQLKVLARLTSGCTRLVDSIFRSHSEGTGPSGITRGTTG